MHLTGGARFSPMFIENKLKFCPYIVEAVVLGHERDFVTAMICIDYKHVGNWAEERRINYTTYSDLAGKPRSMTSSSARFCGSTPACRRRPGSAGSCCSTRNSTPTMRNSPARRKFGAASSIPNIPRKSPRFTAGRRVFRSKPRSAIRTEKPPPCGLVWPSAR